MDKSAYALVSVSVTAAVLAVALAAVTLMSGSTPQMLNNMADESLVSSTLSVTGTAQTTLVPDTLVVTFVVQEKAATS
ncbi:hypothetical protein, partial [Escherichia coli]